MTRGPGLSLAADGTRPAVARLTGADRREATLTPPFLRGCISAPSPSFGEPAVPPAKKQHTHRKRETNETTT